MTDGNVTALLLGAIDTSRQEFYCSSVLLTLDATRPSPKNPVPYTSFHLPLWPKLLHRSFPYLMPRKHVQKKNNVPKDIRVRSYGLSVVDFWSIVGQLPTTRNLWDA
jgi:hypothetical protein